MWWKRLKKRHRFTRKRNLTYLLFLFILLSMGMGYALLNTTLGIDGTSHLANAKWDIHFDNIQVKDGSVTPTSAAAITDDTTVSFSVTLENPGDFYEFNVDVVNAGTINAMIDTISIQPILTENQQKYLDYIVTYEDGTGLAEKQRLDAGDIETLRIAFIYKETDDPDDYPDEDEDITIEVSIIYVQENGDAVDVPHPTTLYGVLNDAAIEGTYAKEYTGSHKDSFTQSPSKKIYYWYIENYSYGSPVLDNNNVLFAGQCWRMIRTTDTGGVKMIYNGEAENNQCLNTRGTHVGYASRTSQNLASNYWYGTDYMYDSTNKTFKVSGTTEQTTWNATTGPGLIGKYTCKSENINETCEILYLVESYKDAANANVIPLNSNSNYSQFGTLEYNVNNSSPADVGYMYNTRYVYNSKALGYSETVLASSAIRTTYWYAHNAVWGSPVASRYNLDDPYQIGSTNDYSNLVGEYTFGNATQTYTSTSVRYIVAINNSTHFYYYIQLGNSRNHTLADYNYTYTYGDSFTDNGDGTYTINNPAIVERKDWYTSYNNIGANKYVCKNAVNDTCSDLWYTTSTSNDNILYLKVANSYKYSKGFTWDGSKYILDNDTSISFWDLSDSTNKESLNNAHYTCWNKTGECTTISYIYYNNLTTPHYININNGKGVEDALDEMLYNDNVNTINSTIKSGVDAWYKHYLLDYDNYIEDTIFCNNRSIIALNGWNPDGGNIRENLQFKEYNLTNDLSCSNITDQFSVSNNNAKLTYKVGLMGRLELNLINIKYRNLNSDYWLISPNLFYSQTCQGSYVTQYGEVGSTPQNIGVSHGVNPAISLIPGITYSSGDGTMANPYVVDIDDM